MEFAKRAVPFYSLALLVAASSPVVAQDVSELLLERSGALCSDDPHCFNRLHPDIPMSARALPGQAITFQTRNTDNLEGPPASTIHPLSGPVYIEGAKAGDTIALTIENVTPFGEGVTLITGNSLLADLFGESIGTLIHWKLGEEYATSESIPDVRIPNRGFPGVVTVLPGPDQVTPWLARERAGVEAGGRGHLPEPVNAVPANLCGPSGTARSECLRTGPPREHGGNMDIRYHSAGTTLYLPCYIDGCGIAIGDVHYAQGDGEVAGTAIEMAADVTVTVELTENKKSLTRGPHYEGPGDVLGPNTGRYYATTGLPIKEAGVVPPHMKYLKSPVASEFTYLSDNLFLAARNALIEMLDYLVQEHGLTREQAYFLASVAVDLRIGQVVDAGHVNVTAIIPLDIFVD
jgi:formamidase